MKNRLLVKMGAGAILPRPDEPYQSNHRLPPGQDLQRLRDARPANRCHCSTCRPITLDDIRMALCPTCGNKRCPHATDHRNACTGSNDPGQAGSAYGVPLQCLSCGARAYRNPDGSLPCGH